MSEFLPPQSHEAEQCVLGSLLIDKEAFIQVSDFIGVDDFYEERHGEIYRAILDLFQRYQPIDVLTVSNILEEKNQLEGIGGSDYLIELTQVVPTASHVYHYAQIVKQKSTLRKLIIAGQQISALGYDEKTDTREVLEQAEKTLFGVSQTFVKSKFVHIKDVLDQSYERIAELHAQKEEHGIAFRGIRTGFHDLDKMLSGLQSSDLVILAARPAMGKTSFALNIAENVARHGKKSVGIFSLEMSKDQLVERMFCSIMALDSWKLRTGQLTDQDLQNIGVVMQELNNINIFIDDAPDCSVIDLRTKARRLQQEFGLDLLIIDYLQLMNGSSVAMNNNQVQKISEISRSLKLLARELQIPIIALSQLSRAVEGRTEKIPQLSDLRDSGSIEQDADIVLFIYRDDVYNPEASTKPGTADIIIAKHRAGPTGKVELGFKKEQVLFVNLDHQHQPPGGMQ
ncbi:MAG: replicative DNA helicase [Candidatus Abawacabacteria bacterium]|nr:replicative DNA helicase [Candidatus Abawacabacteria bacterium]